MRNLCGPEHTMTAQIAPFVVVYLASYILTVPSTACVFTTVPTKQPWIIMVTIACIHKYFLVKVWRITPILNHHVVEYRASILLALYLIYGNYMMWNTTILPMIDGTYIPTLQFSFMIPGCFLISKIWPWLLSITWDRSHGWQSISCGSIFSDPISWKGGYPILGPMLLTMQAKFIWIGRNYSSNFNPITV